MAPLKIIIFLGSVREGRMGIRLATFLKDYLKSRGMAVELFDPEVLPFPLMKKPFYHYQNERDAPAFMKECNDKIKAADGYVVVSAEYNHSIPPALSNMLGHFAISSYAYKPCSIVSYSMGPFGGVRAAVQLRAMLGELGMVSPQFIFAVGAIQDELSEDGKPLDPRVQTGAEKMANELEWYATALKFKREKCGVPK